MAKSNLYVGQDLIGNIYAGSQLISQIYRGSTKVYDVYYDGEVLFETGTVGNHTFTPKVKGLYEVILIGGGGGGACSADQSKYASKSGNAGGGAGGFIKANVFLTGGTTYNISIGGGGTGVGSLYSRTRITGQTGGNSTFSNMVTANGGTGGSTAWTDTNNPTRVGGTGGLWSVSGDAIAIDGRQGNNGSTTTGYNRADGGASFLNGYGEGGYAHAYSSAAHYGSGAGGYIKITYIQHATGI